MADFFASLTCNQKGERKLC